MDRWCAPIYMKLRVLLKGGRLVTSLAAVIFSILNVFYVVQNNGILGCDAVKFGRWYHGFSSNCYVNIKGTLNKEVAGSFATRFSFTN
jgi:hypothetical protein